MRVYQSLAKPYIALANAFKSGNLQRLNSEVEVGQPVWDSVSRQLIARVASFSVILKLPVFLSLTGTSRIIIPGLFPRSWERSTNINSSDLGEALRL